MYSSQSTSDSPGPVIRFVVGLLFFLGGTISHSQQQEPPSEGEFRPINAAQNIYVLHGSLDFPNPDNRGFTNNPGFIVTLEGVVVIDPGSSVQVGRKVLEAVEFITDKPVVATFSTHVHGDHWLGNQAIAEKYPEVKMYAHPGMIEAASTGQAAYWIDLMSQLTEGATDGSTGTVPDHVAGDGDVMQIGEFTFSIFHRGKAHTDSDIAILVAPGETLFTGDLVSNRRLGLLNDGTFLGLIDTLEFLETLKPEVVVPGHGAVGDKSIVSDMKQLHQILYSTVQLHYDQGLADFEIKPRVVEALQQFTDWHRFEDDIGRLVSLGYLEVEENNF
jgi:glyoxylase-like metal-dependent hydrolase (beta-lactamase superfamily II)